MIGHIFIEGHVINVEKHEVNQGIDRLLARGTAPLGERTLGKAAAM